jgi:hypothetical protein
VAIIASVVFLPPDACLLAKFNAATRAPGHSTRRCGLYKDFSKNQAKRLELRLKALAAMWGCGLGVTQKINLEMMSAR